MTFEKTALIVKAFVSVKNHCKLQTSIISVKQKPRDDYHSTIFQNLKIESIHNVKRLISSAGGLTR